MKRGKKGRRRLEKIEKLGRGREKIGRKLHGRTRGRDGRKEWVRRNQ